LLQAALPLLPADQRRVMELRLTGLPATEVAVVLGRTPESVRTLQTRAIKRLQTLLNPTESRKEARHA
jgi:RNA polymerase sigma factor (sigma-70 family)